MQCIVLQLSFLIGAGNGNNCGTLLLNPISLIAPHKNTVPLLVSTPEKNDPATTRSALGIWIARGTNEDVNVPTPNC